MQKILSAAVFGIDAYLVEVEVDLNPARSDWYFATVGLPDAAVMIVERLMPHGA